MNIFAHLKNSQNMMPALMAGLICLAAVIGILAPRALSFVPGLVGLIGVLLLHYRLGQAWPHWPRLYIILCTGIIGLGAFSALWSIEAGFTLERSGKIALSLLPGLLLWGFLDNLNAGTRAALKRYFPLAVLGAGLACLIWLYGTTLLFYLKEWSGYFQTSKLNLSFLNRNVVTLVFLFFPAWHMVTLSDFSARQKKNLKTGLMAVLLLALAITDSQSAQISALIGAGMWRLFPHRRAMWLALKAVTITTILLLPWLAMWGFKYLAPSLSGLPWLSDAYVAPRLEIWNFISHKILENPLYGFGLEATRQIEHFDTVVLFTRLDHVLHPHNGILQIWIEFGLLGIIPFCVFLWVFIHNLSKLEGSAARLCTAMFCMVLAAACTSYGLWQGWWLGLFTLMAALCRFLARPEARTA